MKTKRERDYAAIGLPIRPTRPKRPRPVAQKVARKMWAYTGEGETDGMMFFDRSNPHYQAPHFVIPASSIPLAVEVGARGIAKQEGWLNNWDNFPTLREEALSYSRALLKSLGMMEEGE